MAATLRDALRERVVIADGGVGTSLFAQGASVRAAVSAHGGACEILNALHPDAVSRVHASFLAAGCDAVTTNSFCADPPTLAARGLAGRTYELALAAARLARAEADAAAAGDGRPRFVLGSLGPGLVQPTPRPVDLDALAGGYDELAGALLAGGVDALVAETCRDALQAHAAVAGARRARERLESDALLAVSLTPGRDGRLADGGSLAEAAGVLERAGAELLAISCIEAGPGLVGSLETLAASTQRPLGAWPNAGLPHEVEGHPVWPLGPGEFAEPLAASIARWSALRLVGGCCGTTAEHLAALVERVREP